MESKKTEGTEKEKEVGAGQERMPEEVRPEVSGSRRLQPN